ncbi:hypothetical protein TL16_g12137 [Triparma laevis f. inornata]|uniref:Uncharacterized protein n=2 Tax=Triparma laevis TaxID=1534972 RepID=A0A9W6Z2R9_9STRA|nr:hypothetical protein TrLO_g10348 [Triparma laevis f. longispina]GMH91730.1 hypothetical protein TL16_g12137 [Triparma laevis f. inornata]
MSSLIQSLVDFLYSLIYSLPFFTPTSQTPQKTVLLGLQNSGKSTFLSPQTQHEPTLRPLSKSLTIGSRQFITFDLGGQSNLRSLWSDYVVTGVLVIFVIDVYNFSVVSEEVKEEFEKVKDTCGILAVVFNKIDLSPNEKIEDLKELLLDEEEGEDEDIGYFLTSGLKGEGVREVFEWLGERVEEGRKGE